MPLLALADIGVEDDGQSDQHFERGKLELEMRCHESAKAEAHRDAAEQEAENMTASVGLSEMRGEQVGPAIRLFQHVDRRRDIVHVSAPFAVAPPFVTDLPLAMLLGQVAGPEPAHS